MAEAHLLFSGNGAQSTKHTIRLLPNLTWLKLTSFSPATERRLLPFSGNRAQNHQTNGDTPQYNTSERHTSSLLKPHPHTSTHMLWSRTHTLSPTDRRLNPTQPKPKTKNQNGVLFSGHLQHLRCDNPIHRISSLQSLAAVRANANQERWSLRAIPGKFTSGS
jgi:hypothetical protein